MKTIQFNENESVEISIDEWNLIQDRKLKGVAYPALQSLGKPNDCGFCKWSTIPDSTHLDPDEDGNTRVSCSWCGYLAIWNDEGERIQ